MQELEQKENAVVIAEYQSQDLKEILYKSLEEQFVEYIKIESR